MALETFQYIDDLNASNPTATDNVSQGDDHIRGIKTTLKNTFPNVTGAITPTQTELNYVDGVTSAIQTQLNAKQSASGDYDVGDNVKIKMGASDDLEIFHNGTNSYISDAGTGDLIISGSDDLILRKYGTSEDYIVCNADAGVELYYDASQKFTTTSNGVTVTGRAKGTQTTDNDGSFDLSASNHFQCTPTANFTLTFTNHTAGVAGTIILKNTGGYTVSAHADTLVMGADLLTTISTAGTYVLGYISDGTDTRIYNSGAQQ